MADEKIVTSIVANSDFSNLIADVQKVTSSLSRLQQEFAGANRALAGQIDATNALFAQTMRKTGQFSTHFVSLTSDVEKFGKNLDGGRLKLKDYFRVYQENVRTSGGLIRDLAKQQVQLQNAVLQPLGKNAQGLMQYNVHIPRGLDLTKNKASILRQELSIMNKVIQDGGVQLINWGKNTQWAGRQLTVGLTLPLAAFGKAAADAFKLADQELTRLTKVYGDVAGTSAQELGRVRKEVSQTAKEISASMGVSFTETIGLAADIAATGKTGNELLGSIKETTRLAVLGEVDRQEAMKATLAIQSAFKQNTEELAGSINFLNAVENQTSTTLNDLVEAIPKAGPVIKGLGGSVQDLALYLTAMREGGINASEGANALKSALASLINPTDVAVAKFKGFGIDLLGIVSKNAGDVTGTLFALQAALDRLDPLKKQQAIEQLFGKFQFSRLNALFENLGRQGSQTLQVLDLMKASAGDLEAVASRELTAVTESASGRYRRAIESLRAELAGVGDQFLDIGTKLINVLTKIIDFAQKLPDPVKKIAAFGGAFTAIIGPVIMLTGVLANFFGYIIKGLGHFRALFKGAEGFKLLTPEMMAAKHASEQLGDSFYSDAIAADTLRTAIEKLNQDLMILQKNANGISKTGSGLGAVVATTSGSPIMYMGGPRVADPNHPLIGTQSRAAAHLNPRDPNNPATLFGLTMQPIPVNRKIGKTPQVLMTERLPDVEGLTSVGGTSTGVVAGEHARYAALMATLGMQSRQEIESLKDTIALGGKVSSEFIATFDDILPITQRLTANAATQSAAIVSELRAGKINVEQAKAAIMSVNAELERMLGAEVTAYATGRGRTIDLTKAPLIDQPVVDVAGKPNTRGMFRQGIFSKVMSAVGRATRTKTYGGPYSIETTRPTGLNRGGNVPQFFAGGGVFYNNGDQVPGPNINADVVPAMLTPGEFVIRRSVAQQDPEGMRALNAGQAMIVPTQNRFAGGPILNMLTRLAGWSRSRVGSARRIYETGANPSTRKLVEDGNFGPDPYSSMERRTSSFWTPLLNPGQRKPGEVLAHVITSKYLRRFKNFRMQGSAPAATGSQLERKLGIAPSGNSANKEYQILPDNVINVAEDFNKALAKNAATGQMWLDSKRQPQHLISLMSHLLNAGVPYKVAYRVASRTLSRIDNAMINLRDARLSETKWGNIVDDAMAREIENIQKSYRIQSQYSFNRGGEVPGYALGGGIKIPSWIIRNEKIRNLANTDPLHGPLQIGRYISPLTIRNRRQGASVQYRSGYRPFTWDKGPRAGETVWSPGRTSSTEAFLTGSLEDRGRYVTEEYMRGNYSVLKIPGAIDAMKAWGKKASGTFHRGITLKGWSRVGGQMKPLPDWLVGEIEAAKASGDFSRLVGKEFIMRRSSWSSNAETAAGFGDFQLKANVRNRRVTPASQMFPELDFYTPGSKVKVNESESIFGGKFRIVGAGPNGLELETVSGPMGGKRAMGGPVNAGVPYVVGENGPEVFVPRNNGGIIPNKGKIPGVQHRAVGGPILGLLAALGIGYGGQKLGEKVGGGTGQAITTASYMLPMLMGPGMFSSGMRRGGPEAAEWFATKAGVGQNASWGKTSFLGNMGTFGARLGEAAAQGKGFQGTIAKLLFGISRFTVAIGAASAAVYGLYKVFQNYQKTQKLSALEFGLTAEAAQKAGLKYTDYGQKIKDTLDAQKLMIQQNKLTYQSMASAGTPFRMTIAEYKALKKEVKDTMGAQIEMLNAVSKQDVNRVAVQLKEQFIAAGMSAEEATKKIYTLLQLSNKSSQTTSAMSTKPFMDIVNAQTAAVSALKTFNYAKTFENAKDQASALNTALTAIDMSISDLYGKAEKAAAKKQQDFNVTDALYRAEASTLELINSKVKNQDSIGKDVLNNLAKQNPLIIQFANAQDSVVSLWQKMRIAARGYTEDLSGLNQKQTAQLYTLTVSVAQAVEESNKTGLLKKQYDAYNALKQQQKELLSASKGQSVQEQINARDAIRAIDKKIKKINEEADARKEALRQEAQAEDIALRVQQQRLEYEKRLSSGDFSGAAESQIELQRLLNEQQVVLTEQQIEEKRKRDVAPLERQRDKLQAAQEALSDKAALAAESLESVNKRLSNQKTKIDEVNNAMSAFKVGLMTGSDNIKGLAAAFIKSAQEAGIAVSEYNYVGGGKVEKADPVQLAKDLLNKAGENVNTILAQKGVTIQAGTGDIYINGKKMDTPGQGTKDNPYVGGRASDVPSTGMGDQPGVDLDSWSWSRIGINSVRQQVKKYAEMKGYEAGDYFTLTTGNKSDGTLKVHKFKVEKDGNITRTEVKESKATGGLLKGPGTGTSDSILGVYSNGGMVRVSNGEYVINAETVSKLGVPFFDKINNMKNGGLMLNYDIPKYGNGSELIETRAYQPASGGVTYNFGNVSMQFAEAPANGKQLFEEFKLAMAAEQRKSGSQINMSRRY